LPRLESETAWRIFAVGSKPVNTWEEARTQIQAHADTVAITVERSGQRRELSVTPRNRRIGVSPKSEMRPISVGDAAALGVVLPLKVVKEAARSFTSWHSVDKVEVKGPVGIVKESGTAAKDSWLSLLYFLAAMGSYCWPFVAAVHLFDSLTAWVFRTTLTETNLPPPTLRIAGLRFSLQFSLGCWLAFLLAEAAAVAGAPGALLLVALLMPGVYALWPLLWISARTLWSNKSSWGLFPITLIPCGAPIIGISIALSLRKEERRLRTHSEPNVPSS
jgi:hypothetical protein